MTTSTSTSTSIQQQTFSGLAFPVVRVRFAGPTNTLGARYIATVRNTRIVRSFDYDISPSESALRAGLACWARYVSLERMEPYNPDAELLIPGDLSDDSYAFTVVPRGFFEDVSAEVDS